MTNTIAYITDGNYVEYTFLSLKSLLKYVKDDVNIYVICNSVSDVNKRKLEIDDRIKLIDYSGKDAKRFPGRRYLTNTMFIKFELPNILNVDTCLYLDGDTIMVNDISELLNFDVSDSVAAVVKDFGEAYIWTPLNAAKRGLTFNCGVMLLNLKKMREENYTERLYSKRSLMTSGGISDQEVFNFVFIDDVSYLPPKFNVSMDKIKSDEHKEFRNIELYNKLYETKYSNIDAFLNDAAILHFHGDKKIIYNKLYIKKLLQTINN